MMNNGDLPAMPMDSVSSDRAEEGYFYQFAYGLTKREMLASMAMQGMVSNPNLNSGQGFTGAEISALSVAAADSLLKALEDSSTC